jgi:predicted Fe-Mo cluster-binding NifX family protein
MRLGIATHEGRISPVLDVAQCLRVVSIDGQTPTGHRDVAIIAGSLCGRAQEIQATEIDVLICGALSRPLESALTALGIHVTAQVCGDVEAVLDAYLAGRLTEREFLMPGCCGRRRRRGRHSDAPARDTARSYETT